MAPDSRCERPREGSGSQAGEGTPPVPWMPGPGPGSPLSVSLQTSVSKGVSLGAQSLRGVTPAAEGGLGKNLLGKVPELPETSAGKGQSPYAGCAARGSGGEVEKVPEITPGRGVLPILDLQERQIWVGGHAL